ncbi:hypothetical protein DFQ30_002794 [Apophysomyces sp. BC1015]|nr:hypothetical protein DFQ30_002794 [Apophysomyces sp. BC1015]
MKHANKAIRELILQRWLIIDRSAEEFCKLIDEMLRYLTREEILVQLVGFIPENNVRCFVREYAFDPNFLVEDFDINDNKATFFNLEEKMAKHKRDPSEGMLNKYDDDNA